MLSRCEVVDFSVSVTCFFKRVCVHARMRATYHITFLGYFM